MTIADVERRTTTEHATILWRVRRVAWHRFTRQYRRSLVITQGLVIAGVAIALPLYLQVVGYDIPGRESTLGRELPPDTETALSWALWTTQVGTFAAAAIVAALVGVRLQPNPHTCRALAARTRRHRLDNRDRWPMGVVLDHHVRGDRPRSEHQVARAQQLSQPSNTRRDIHKWQVAADPKVMQATGKQQSGRYATTPPRYGR
ncbi:hypothetical protein [Williamsia muralis]|uniref:hypothetical protein n=1 Tax=Williamsia marianensis TaxID=85044 RepID=UPI000AB282BE|nr:MULTISPECIES: hypothetical protein [Williamsia]